MKSYSLYPREILSSFWRHRELIVVMTRREVLGRYQGSIFGVLWSFLNPLFMLAVYTFVFSVVFKARWGGGAGSKAEFALVLFAGLMVFNIFAECVNRAPSLILSNANYVKKVVFPLEILPWVALGAALFHAAVGFLVWLIAYLLLVGMPHATILFLPVVVLPLLLFVMGVSWFLSALGVYLRDISQFTGVLTTVAMFMSPVFYSAQVLPEAYQKLLYLNPLTPAIEQARDVMYWGRLPDAALLLVCYSVALLTAWLGFVWFQKTRKGFADVI